MKHPLLVPEKRPSVTTAQEVSRPHAARYFIGAYISGMPGPPRRPMKRIRIAVPAAMWAPRMASLASAIPGIGTNAGLGLTRATSATVTYSGFYLLFTMLSRGR